MAVGMQPYRGLFPLAGRTLPVTEAVVERVMILPTGLALGQADVALLTSRIAAIVRQAPAVRVALARCRDPRLPAFVTSMARASAVAGMAER